MRAALYTRVSTGDQEVANQRPDLVTFVQSRGWELASEYSDVGISGTKMRRPALDRLMEDAKKRKFDAIIVWRFDRYARSTKHLIDSLEEFRNLGIRFLSYSENIDLGTPLGQAMFVIISAIAQLELDLMRERIMAGLRRAKAEGKKLGRPAKAIDTSKIRELRSQGLTVREIAQTLNLTKSRVAQVVKAQAVPLESTAGGTQIAS